MYLVDLVKANPGQDRREVGATRLCSILEKKGLQNHGSEARGQEKWLKSARSGSIRQGTRGNVWRQGAKVGGGETGRGTGYKGRGAKGGGRRVVNARAILAALHSLTDLCEFVCESLCLGYPYTHHTPSKTYIT